jgi:hypothetical protein
MNSAKTGSRSLCACLSAMHKRDPSRLSFPGACPWLHVTVSFWVPVHVPACACACAHVFSPCRSMQKVLSASRCSVVGPYVVAKGKKVLNMVSFNFLGVAGDASIRVRPPFANFIPPSMLPSCQK